MKLLIFALLVALALGQDMEMEMEKEDMLDMLAPRLMDIMMKMTYMHMAKSMKEGKRMQAGLCPHVQCGLCVGGPESPFGEKMMKAMMNCNIDMESDDTSDSEVRMMDEDCMEEMMMKFGDKMTKTCCMLHELGWMTEDDEYAPEVIKMDLASTLIADKLADTECMCMKMSESITPDCIAQLEMCPFGTDMEERCDEEEEEERCDMDEDEDEDRCDEEEEDDDRCDEEEEDGLVRQSKKKSKRGRKARRAAKKAKRAARKAKRQAKKQKKMEDAMVLEIVKGMAYFGCIHHSFEKSCMDAANEVLGYVLMHDGDM